MFSIGEFSKITGLTVKTLRFYHEQGILTPSSVEAGSGYRFYAESKIETARIITALRQLEFSIAEIADIIHSHDDDSSILVFLETRKAEVQQRLRNDRQIVKLLDDIITHEREASRKMSAAKFDVVEKTLPEALVASIRMKGPYNTCGSAFGRIGRKYGRVICGKPMLLQHDNEYREEADFEAAMPIKKGEPAGEIEVRKLVGGPCLSLMHLGPYEDLGRSYEIIVKYAKDHEFQYSTPSREIYHKGPGMIFRGNPQKYLTEIQLMIDTPSPHNRFGASDR